MQLEWSEHSAQLVSGISGLLASKDLLDVTLSAEGKAIRAHKVVLAAASDHFRDLLTLDMESSPIIYLRDVSASDLQSLLQFIYSGTTDVQANRLQGFLSLAKGLQVKGFTEETLEKATTKHSKTPVKRKLIVDDKENKGNDTLVPPRSPLKPCNSEPTNLDSLENKEEQNRKRKKMVARSLDDMARKSGLSGLSSASTSFSGALSESQKSPVVVTPFWTNAPVAIGSSPKPKENIYENTSEIFKMPYPVPLKDPPPYGHASTKSCPEEATTNQEHNKQEARATVSYPGNGIAMNSSLDVLDPNELAAKGATLLHHLALWMMEEKKQSDDMTQTQSAANTMKTTHNLEPTSNTLPRQTVPSSTVARNTTSLGATRGRHLSSKSRLRRGSSECDARPDSGFDSKDEVSFTPTPPPMIKESNEAQTSSAPSSPEGGEITRQAPIRQPVFRKRRMQLQ